MILYHGTNTDIKTINLGMCRPYKDFGTGFYLTSIKFMDAQASQEECDNKIYNFIDFSHRVDAPFL